MLVLVQGIEKESQFVNLPVKNVQEMEDFYHLVLQLPIIGRAPKHWCQLGAGNYTLSLDRIYDLSHLKAAPPLVFFSNNYQQIAPVLKDKSVISSKLSVTSDGKYYYCSGRDPENNVFQLLYPYNLGRS